MQEINHVIDILEKAKRAIREKNVVLLKELSNQTVHTASIYQDPDNIAIAVVLYSLSKLIERQSYKTLKGWQDFEKNYVLCIDKAIIFLRKRDLENYRLQMECIREGIKSFSKDLKKYIDEVFRKASINKATRLYEHGLSLEKTANILGVTVWELNQYVGQTGVADVNLAYTLDLNKRIKQAEDIFR